MKPGDLVYTKVSNGLPVVYQVMRVSTHVCLDKKTKGVREEKTIGLRRWNIVRNRSLGNYISYPYDKALVKFKPITDAVRILFTKGVANGQTT